MGPFLILFIVLPGLILIGYYILTKNRERMKLIEKGINPDEGLSVKEFRKQNDLKNGILLLTLGLGLLIGHTLNMKYGSWDDFIVYVTMLLIFGGIGFLINYLILKNWNHK